MNVNPGQLRQVQALIRNPSSAEPVQRLAFIIAEIERAQADALADLADALDAPDVGAAAVDVEDRRDELLALAEAAGPGGDLAEWYARHRLAPPLDAADAPQVAAYVGMDSEEWEDQIEAWAAAYRTDGENEDYTDRQLADAHLASAYGAPSIEWWEREVVEVDVSRVMRDALAGRLEAIEDGIRAAAEHADA